MVLKCRCTDRGDLYNKVGIGQSMISGVCSAVSRISRVVGRTAQADRDMLGLRDADMSHS